MLLLLDEDDIGYIGNFGFGAPLLYRYYTSSSMILLDDETATVWRAAAAVGIPGIWNWESAFNKISTTTEVETNEFRIRRRW